MDTPPAPPDTSLRLPRSWLNTGRDGEAYWPTAADYLAELRARVGEYERKARRRQRLTFDEARDLRRLLACLADVEAGREGLSTADRTILEDAGGRLRQALADLATLEGLDVAPLLGELRQRYSPAWCGLLRLTLSKRDEYGARGMYLDATEAARYFTAKVRSGERLTTVEVDRLHDVVKSRIAFRAQLEDPDAIGYREDYFAWRILRCEFEAAYRRIGRVLSILSMRYALSPGGEWANGMDMWSHRGPDPLGKLWHDVYWDGFWSEFRRRAEEPMGKSDTPHGIKAGAAFKAMMESDPATKTAWERTRAKLQAFGKAMQEAMNAPEYRAAQEAERRKWQDLADAIRERLNAAGDSLAAQHLPRPESIEDWEHLARIVEIPLETIQSGKLTAREIHACALAWADRQKIKAKLAASAHGQTPAPAPGAKVEAEDTGDVGGPTEDPHDNRVAWWVGKRIYLGNDTEVSRLFWLLAKPVGRAANLAQVQRAIDGMETDRDGRPDDVRKAAQRVRKVISKLRAALREAGLDDHVLIVKDGPRADPQYSMVWRFGK